MGLLQALGLAALPAPASVGEADAESSKQGEGKAAQGDGPAKGDGGGESPLDIKADVAAVLQQVLDLVLGGIPDDEARKAVNAEYLKLKAAFDKADKLGSTKAKVTAYQAILQPAQDLRAKAEGIRYTFGLWDGNGKPLVGPARAAIGKIEGTAKAVLETTLAGLEADALRAARAGDSTALQSTLQPKLVRLHAIATQLPKRSKEIDDGIAAAAKVLLALDKKRASELLARLARLQDAKKSGWPAGATFEEVAASVDGLLAEARALQTEGKELTTNLADERELEAVRKRLDGLKPRIDRASETGMPPYIEQRQANVRNFAKVIEEQMAAKNKAAVLKTLGSLTLSLGDMEQMKDRHAAYRKKFEAARDGPVKKARALKLAPADFAPVARHPAAGPRERDRGVHRQRRVRPGAAHDRRLDPAGRCLGQGADGLQEPARQVARRRRPRGPGQAARRRQGARPARRRPAADDDAQGALRRAEGALRRRHHAVLEHMKQDDERQARLGHRREHEARSERVQDIRRRRSTSRACTRCSARCRTRTCSTSRRSSASPRTRSPRSTTAACSTTRSSCTAAGPARCRPTRPSSTRPARSCRRANRCSRAASRRPAPPTRPWFDFTVLHEVGHAVDDARNIMSGERGNDAGWVSHGTGTIAEKIAAKVGYDRKYIEKMLDDKTSTPPKKAPKPPEGTSQADWDKAQARGRGLGARTSGSTRSPGATPPWPRSAPPPTASCTTRATRAVGRLQVLGAGPGHHRLPVPRAGRVVRRAVRGVSHAKAQPLASGVEVAGQAEGRVADVLTWGEPPCRSSRKP